MIQVPITNIANQSLSINLDNNQYNLTIKATNDNIDGTTNVMSVDITINNEIILTGLRAVPGFPLIPYKYLVNGNFTFITDDDSYPDWRQFGITQYLIFASNDELEAIANDQ